MRLFDTILQVQSCAFDFGAVLRVAVRRATERRGNADAVPGTFPTHDPAEDP
jgi:hypothetical protein